MINLKLVKNQPHWRVALVHLFARMTGVLIHVEGFPFGSARHCKSWHGEGDLTGSPSAFRLTGSMVSTGKIGTG